MAAPEQIGRYRIVGELGRGAMGIVYRAHDERLERNIALKVVQRPEPNGPPVVHEAYARFLRESKLAGKLTHPAIVTIHDVGEDLELGLSFIAMECVDGEPLDRLLARREQLDPDQVRAIGIQVASALQAAHAAGIVHRDIKPANLILTSSGDVKVTDFGIAKNVNAQMTHDGSFLGSPQYMSPEQIHSAQVDHRSDLFSLGVVLYELATLEPAFSGNGVLEMIKAVVEQEPIPPRRIRADLPGELEGVILRALAKDREDRFQSAAEMRSALEGKEFVAPTPVPGTQLDPEATQQAGPPTVVSGAADSPAPTKRSRWLPIALVSVLLAAAGWWGLNRGLRSGDTPSDSSASEPAGSSGVGALTPTPSPTPTPRAFPYVIKVEHHHRMGSCRGWLRIYENHVEYDSYDRDRDDDRWGYGEITSFSYTPPRELGIEIERKDKLSLGLLRKNYRFRIEGDPDLSEALPWVQQKLAQ